MRLTKINYYFFQMEVDLRLDDRMRKEICGWVKPVWVAECLHVSLYIFIVVIIITSLERIGLKYVDTILRCPASDKECRNCKKNQILLFSRSLLVKQSHTMSYFTK